MAGSNLYQDLKNALTDFKNFLDANTDKIAPAIQAPFAFPVSRRAAAHVRSTSPRPEHAEPKRAMNSVASVPANAAAVNQ